MIKTKIFLLGFFIPLLFSCKDRGVEIRILGEIIPYDEEKSYDIQIKEADKYSEKFIEMIDEEQIVKGKIDFSFRNKINFNAIMEVRENDTIRCILIPASNYMENPVTGDMFAVIITDTLNELKIHLKGVKFEIDRDSSNLLDYNLGFIIPAMKVENGYRKVTGSLDTLPEEGRLTILVDGGGKRSETFEFHTKTFDVETSYKIDYLNFYITSKYGWQKHLKEYDIKKFSLHFSETE